MSIIAISDTQPANLRHLIYGLHPLLGVMTERKLDYLDILQQFQVAKDSLTSPDSHITPSQELGIITAALERLQQPSIGLEIGARYHLSSFGLLGLAAMSSANLQSCYEMFFKHLAMTWSYFQFSLISEKDNVLLAMDPIRDLGASYQFMLDRDIYSAYRIANEVLDKRLPLVEVRLKQKQSDYPEKYQDLFQCPIVFNAQHNAVVFKKRWLNESLAKSEPDTSRIFEVQCATVTQAITREYSFAEHVRYHIMNWQQQTPKIETLASELNTTPRTIQRKLSAEGTTYKKLLEEIRINIAIEFLQTSQFSIEEISSHLGYSETSSFSHAFKSWTGKSPSSYRE